MCLVFVLSGHKFKDVEKISGKYEPGPWYGASLRTKKLVPQDINTLCGSRIYPYPTQGSEGSIKIQFLKEQMTQTWIFKSIG